MKIQVTIGGDTPAEVSKLAAEVASLLGGKPASGGGTAAPAGKPADDAAAKAKAKADADAKAKAEKDAKAKADADAKAKAAAAGSSGGIDLNGLRDMGRACIKAGKNAEMKAALAELGADSITTLDPAKYAELQGKLNAILNPEAPADGSDAL